MTSIITKHIAGLFLFMLFFSMPAQAQDNTQRNLMWYGYAIMSVDYLQTRDIISNPRYEEANPILGRNPTTRQLNSAFAFEIMLHTVMQDTKYRKTWNWTVAIAHTVAVLHNKSIGVSVKF